MQTRRIRLVHCDSLSCEPIVRRTPEGNLLCVSQVGDVTEPAPGNRVHAFLSTDNGDTWQPLGSVYPESGEAVYCSEVMVLGGVISAFVHVHSGRFLNLRCMVMQSRDGGRTWRITGPVPYFPTFCFVRSVLPLADGSLILPVQRFPISEEENARLVIASHNISNFRHQRAIWNANIDRLENWLLISRDAGGSYECFNGPSIPIRGDTGRGWVWTEPTLAQLSDGTIVMLMRVDGSGWLWRSESKDMGRSWSAAKPTDIPNPGNKPKLIPMPDGRIALIHTPNPVPSFHNRFPLSIWISDDDLASFAVRHVVTDFPGRYCYPDGFYEDGHILFTIEINRHEILFFDCEV